MGRAHKFHHTSQRSVTAVHYTLANLEGWKALHAANNFQVGFSLACGPPASSHGLTNLTLSANGAKMKAEKPATSCFTVVDLEKGCI